MAPSKIPSSLSDLMARTSRRRSIASCSLTARTFSGALMSPSSCWVATGHPSRCGTLPRLWHDVGAEAPRGLEDLADVSRPREERDLGHVTLAELPHPFCHLVG